MITKYFVNTSYEIVDRERSAYDTALSTSFDRVEQAREQHLINEKDTALLMKLALYMDSMRSIRQASSWLPKTSQNNQSISVEYRS